MDESEVKKMLAVELKPILGRLIGVKINTMPEGEYPGGPAEIAFGCEDDDNIAFFARSANYECEIGIFNNEEISFLTEDCDGNIIN